MENVGLEKSNKTDSGIIIIQMEQKPEAVLNNQCSVYEIFGNDAMKVRACMLLFASVSDEPVFKRVIAKYGWH